MTRADLFNGHPQSEAIHEAVRTAIAKIGPAEERVSKSQAGFYRQHPFAATWVPGQYLDGDVPPLALSIYLKRRDSSERWKHVVEPAKGRFTHHVELRHATDVDDFIERQLAEAWAGAA